MRRQAQNFSEIFNHQEGWRFTASLQPIKDMKIYNDDYFEVRQILRVPDPTRVQPGDCIWQRPDIGYLLGHYEDRPGLYRAFRCYLLTGQAKWERQVTVIDPLTQLPKGAGKEDLGMLHIVSEVVAREERGGDIKVREEVKRVLTGSPVQLNDLINGEKVVKVNETLGIRVLEVV